MTDPCTATRLPSELPSNPMHWAKAWLEEAFEKPVPRNPHAMTAVTVDETGNTSAASIPLALDIAVRDGRIERGQTIMLEAFGGGFTWGSALLKY